MRSIREIEPADVPALFRVRTATDENRLSLAELAALGITEASVRDTLKTRHKGWLCEDEGTMVGFAIGDRITGEMCVIAVLPSHIRQGIGGLLLDRVEQWLLAEGCPELWLWTAIDPQTRAYSFYRKRGWVDWKIEGDRRYLRKTPPG